MKKACATCSKKIGFLTLNCEIQSGECICDKCLDALGLPVKLYTSNDYKECFKVLSLEDVQQALAGDTGKLEYILNLSSANGAASQAVDTAVGVFNKAKDVAGATVQKAQEQVQQVQAVNKKACATCGKKLGFLASYLELISGERICYDCLGALGLSSAHYVDNDFLMGFMPLSLEDIKQALDGDKDKLEHIHGLSSIEIVAVESTDVMEQQEQEQSQTANKKQCAICGEKIGFFSLTRGLKNGEQICTACLEALGLTIDHYGKDSFTEGFKNLSLNDIKQAFAGDKDKLECVFNLLPPEQRGVVEEANAKQRQIFEDAQAKKEINDKFNNLFVATKVFKNYVEFDDTNKLWRVQRMDDKFNYSYEYYAYSIIMDVKLTESSSEQTITKQKGGTLNYLIGDTMGALTEDRVSTTKKTLHGCTIMVTTDSISSPTVSIMFPGSESLLALAEECVAVFKIIKSNNERSNVAPVPQATPAVNQVSAADELIKFKGLLDAGILTQEEFDKKKAELLNL